MLQIDKGDFEKAETLSITALDTFPAQTLLYLINGVANNRLGRSNKAIEMLETGLDFLLEDPKMERDFYQQLQEAYTKKGDIKRADEYGKRASQINIPN